MKVLLDTHAYFWWEKSDPRLSPRARKLIAEEDTQVVISAVVAWELASKARIGKWPDAADVARTLMTL